MGYAPFLKRLRSCKENAGCSVAAVQNDAAQHGVEYMKVDHEKAANWLSSRTNGMPKCSCCGDKNWGIAEEFMHIRSYDGPSSVIGGVSYAYVALTCISCSNTNLFNAQMMGLMGDASPAPMPATIQV